MQKTNYQKVIEFHEVFDIPYAPTLSIDNIKNFQIASLRIKLIDEEFNELMNSDSTNDYFDAIGDLLYVVYGTGVSFGINLDTEFIGYCRNKIQNSEFFYSTADECEQYIVNGSNFQKIGNLFGINKDACENFIVDFDYTLMALSYSVLSLNTNLITYNLCSMLHMLYDLCKYSAIDADKLFSFIHDSNMTKMCHSEKEAQDTVNWYLKKNNIYDPYYVKSKNDKYWIVYDKKTQKCLKSINYSPPIIKFD